MIKGTNPAVPGGPAFLYVLSAQRQDDLAATLRIRDSSRQLSTAGTEIPLVWESDVEPGPVHLVNVPFRDSFRNWLRIYELGSTDGSIVKVTVYDEEGSVVAEQSVTLSYPLSHEPPQWPSVPAYAAVNLSQLVPGAIERTRIEIEPVTPGIRIWGFVSITHDETQHVTVVTPQP